MRILVVAATAPEVGQLISGSGISIYDPKQKDQEIISLNHNYSILITGVGMVATAFALGKHLTANQYDLAINLGIAGSFDRSIDLGDVVEISQDTFAELGAEDNEKFLPLAELGFGESTFYPSAKLSNFSKLELKNATGITVNAVHGNERSIHKVTGRLSPQVESMEGAAFFYACREMNLPCMQIRAVSNYVEKRNRDNWNIALAIKNLNNFAVELLNI